MKTRECVHGRAFGVYAAALVAGLFCLLIGPEQAHAIPSFARKYETTCTTCHTVYPVLNPFGEAFRRNGYRMPSVDGSLDSDSIKADMIDLGQDEYKKTFPNSVWPAKLMKAVPLSIMVNGGVAANLPNSEAKDSAGNTFTWDGIAQEFHIFGAGALNDNLTYFTELTVSTTEGVSLESAYLLWNDVVGPDHLVNIWLGRLAAPQLTSFGNHSSYVGDTFTPGVSIAQLFNPNGTFVLGHNDSDGVEVNGIVAHRLDYSVGWLASKVGDGINKLPNAQDAYVHVGGKIGGMTLDGEGPGAERVANVNRPWEETALTVDAFAYHGLTRFPNAVNSSSFNSQQTDTINALGAAMRLQIKSFTLNGGIQVEQHSRPFAASTAPDHSSASGFTQYDEINYVVFPWLVPAVRMELTQLSHKGESTATLMRLVPGVALLPRPNVKVVLTASIESANNMPPGGLGSQGQTSWDGASGFSAPRPGKTEIKAQQVGATVALAF